MNEVTLRDLRKHADKVIGRVEAGERLVVTRAGQQVAELTPVRRRPVAASTLLKRWSTLPNVDPAELRTDLDGAVNPSW